MAALSVEMSLNFSTLNETDVREGIIAPFLKELGYETGTVNDIRRAVSLRYPYDHLGRKKRGKDRPLKGEADYVMTLKTGDAHLRWVIEAKGGNEPLDADAIDQAYTYARHPEVGAVMYAVCNGREFSLFRTPVVPHATPPLFQGSWPDWKSNMALRDIIEPNALRTYFREITEISGQPLGYGLGSSESLKFGFIRYEEVDPSIHRELYNINHPLLCGQMDRSPDGLLRLAITIGHHNQAMQERILKWGLGDNLLTSDDTRLSDHARSPSVFKGGRQLIFPKGGAIFNRLGEEIILEEDLVANHEIEASGHLEDGIFKGRIAVHTIVPSRAADVINKGVFQIRLR